MPPGKELSRFNRWGMRVWTRLDSWFFKRFGWSAAARMMGVDVLLLRTTGRRSGLRREVMVACLSEPDGALTIGGGNWGWDNDPGWFLNLSANPDVEIVRGGVTERRHAVVLAGEEAARAAEAVGRAYPHSQVYVSRRVRPVPYVRLVSRK
jgi:deazaflavin-dependent oxidoreductase (nitroreductase family)